MKTLIIHPEDESTNFLCAIYSNLPDCTVMRSGFFHNEVRAAIKSHDRIIMLGHGSPGGLFNVNEYEINGSYVIDNRVVDLLREKKDSIFIWCNADQFVTRNKLSGFYSGMFISEVDEACCYNISAAQFVITNSNDLFSTSLGLILKGTPSLKQIHERIKALYYDPIDQVISFNNARLYYTN